jgi:class 3 adenylate cyclase
MGMISTKSIDQPDESVSAPRVTKRIVTVGETVIARIECQPGWRWSEDIKPTARTGSCQHHHQGIVLSGRLHVASEEGGERIIRPGDAFDILPGHDAWIPGDEPCVMIEFQGARDWGKPAEAGQRVLATLLVTDIVGSTAAAVQLGDVAWKALLARHYDSVRRELRSFRGVEVDASGDGFLAMFDGAARAARCAASIREAALRDGIEVRAGIHSGEVERHGEDLRGVAVHIAARIAALAQPGEILLSTSAGAILEGSGIDLIDAGEHALKGLSGRRRLFRLDDTLRGDAGSAPPSAATSRPRC